MKATILKWRQRALYGALLALFGLVFVSCNLDLVNPNSATEAQVLKTKEGLFGLAVGMENYYATRALGSVITNIAVTAREASAVTTYSSLENLEDGGPELAGDNERVSRTFSRLYRVKGMAEDIIANVDDLPVSEGTKNGLFALANLYRALCLGNLAQNWEYVAIVNDRNGQATYSPRQEAFQEAVRILEASIQRIESGGLSDEFVSRFYSEEEMLNKLYAHLARYSLFGGDYQKAIDAAKKVDLTKAYFFSYDGENKNPVYVRFVEDLVELAPRDNAGLPDELAPDPNDGRLAFYFVSIPKVSLVGLPIDSLICPFFTTLDASIPFYNPYEMVLIEAEAQARLGNIDAAEAALNRVRNKKPEDDPLAQGLAANLPDTYSSNGDVQALLNEIYKNRRLELYLTGMALEDSRRFGRPDPPRQIDYNSERNRNFYPYPSSERSRNPNCPPDPDI